MSEVHVLGLGAVSPAGWGTAALCAALDKGEILAPRALDRPGWPDPLQVLEVPPPLPRPAFLSHARLRRASPITHYAAAAAFEACEQAKTAAETPPSRMGLVMCILTGCCQYSCRFYEETLKDPATASPLIFPETVFNAPASHVGALLGIQEVACTLVGDPATFLLGMALAADWLAEGRVDTCLVVGAEETNWLLADVVWHFSHGDLLSSGAGALVLGSRSPKAGAVRVERITDAGLFLQNCSRAVVARRMRESLPAAAADEVLCDSQRGHRRADAAERLAWRDWTGARLSPKKVLGEGLMAGGAWQCVAACHSLSAGRFRAANVSIACGNHQAVGARFIRSVT